MCWNRTRSVPPPTPHDTRAACQRGTGPSNLSDSRLDCRSVSRESTVRSPGRYVDARAHIYVLTPRTPRLLHCCPSPCRAPAVGAGSGFLRSFASRQLAHAAKTDILYEYRVNLFGRGSGYPTSPRPDRGAVRGPCAVAGTLYGTAAAGAAAHPRASRSQTRLETTTHKST